MTKYGFEVPTSTLQVTITRLTNQLWKLIPMRENKEDWQKQLETLILEISGLNEIFAETSNFIQLLSKLEGLRIQKTTFDFYRKTVFESISLIQGLIK